ncbi:hypothetical protein PENANT_c001G10800, partial [Penicillium antarcticum]
LLTARKLGQPVFSSSPLTLGSENSVRSSHDHSIMYGTVAIYMAGAGAE